MANKLKKLNRILLVLSLVIIFSIIKIEVVSAGEFNIIDHPFVIRTEDQGRLKLELPADYQFESETEVDLVNESFSFSETEKIATNEAIEYSINLAGYEFRGKGIYLTETGLYLKELTIDLEDKAKREIYYNGDSLEVETLDNRILFEDVQLSADTNQVVGEYTCNHSYYIRYGDWIVEVEASLLTSDNIVINGNIEVKNLYSDFTLPIEKMELSTDLTGSQVEFEAFKVEIAPATDLEFKASFLAEDKLSVAKAELEYNKDNNFVNSEVGNFYLEPDATFIKEINYYSKATELDYEGNSYLIPADKLFFDNRQISIEKAVREVDRESYQTRIAVGPFRIGAKSPQQILWLGAEIDGVLIEAFVGSKEDDYFNFKQGRLYFKLGEELLAIALEDINYGPTGLDFSEVKVKADDFFYQDFGWLNYDELIFDEGKFILTGDFSFAEDLALTKAVSTEFVIANDRQQEEIKLNLPEQKAEFNGWEFRLYDAKIDEFIEFEADIKLPAIEALGDTLADKYLSLKELKVDETGQILALKETEVLDYNKDLDLSGGYKLSLRDIEIRADEVIDGELRLYFSGAALFLPSYYTGGYIWLDEINFDSSGKLYYNEQALMEWLEEYKVEFESNF